MPLIEPAAPTKPRKTRGGDDEGVVQVARRTAFSSSELTRTVSLVLLSVSHHAGLPYGVGFSSPEKDSLPSGD
jgi:hypothetical protein